MIPVELTLKNFMSYGERPETLSFQDFHTACLSGDNGNGKSALLDAITWALWGRTRIAGSAVTGDEALIRTGADEMAVRFEFEADHKRYRIIKRLKRGQSTLKPALVLTVSTLQEDGTWKKLGALQGSVQKRIDKIVGMSFEVFVQSAYLLQGRWDMFSRNSPARRRALLSEAFGLSVYERLCNAAADETRRCRKDISRLEGLLRKVDTNSATVPRLVSLKQVAELAVAEAARSLAVCEEQVARLNTETVRNNQILSRRLHLTQQLRIHSEQYNEINRSLTDLQRELNQMRAVVSAREAVERDFHLLQQLIAQRDTIAAMVIERTRCEAELDEARGRLQHEEDKLLAEIQLAEAELEANKKESGRVIEIDARLADLTRELQVTEAHASELAMLKAQLDDVEQQFEQVRGRHDLLKQQLSDFEQIMAAAIRQNRCVECEMQLDQAHLRSLVERQKRRHGEMASEIEMLRTRGVRLSHEKRALVASVAVAADAVNEAARLQGALAEQKMQRRNLQALAEAYDASTVKLATLKARHKSGDFGPALRIKVRQLEGEHQRLSTLATQLQDVQAQITQLEPARDRYQQFSQAGSRLTELAAEEEKKRTQLSEIDNRISVLNKELADISEPELSEDSALTLQQFQKDAESAQRELHEKQLRLASVEVELKAAEQAALEAAEIRQEIATVSEQLALNSTLAQVFGADGIPFSILTELVSKLQSLANALLASLSAGRLSVELLMEKAARTISRDGAVLEILVNDGAGSRPYELFSGGEAFRVNFALRLALSKLLASVAGVSLSTLFIDEGFGSQDGSGRQRIVEMLRTIEQEFSKVVVITHVDEIKDSFSTRIEVTRDLDGSHIALVNSQGMGR